MTERDTRSREVSPEAMERELFGLAMPVEKRMETIREFLDPEAVPAQLTGGSPRGDEASAEGCR